MDQSYYKPIYKTAEARVLYLTGIKGYRSLAALAEDLDVHRQWISYVFKNGLSIKFAGYLGRRFNFNPALLNYENYISLVPRCNTYDKLFLGSNFFSEDDIKYILKGSYIKDPHKHVRVLDKAI